MELEMPDSFGNDYGDVWGESEKKESSSDAGLNPFGLPCGSRSEDVIDEDLL